MFCVPPLVKSSVLEPQRRILVFFALGLDCPVPVLEAMAVCALQRVTMLRPFSFLPQFYTYLNGLVGSRIRPPYFLTQAPLNQVWIKSNTSMKIELECRSNRPGNNIAKLVLFCNGFSPKSFLYVYDNAGGLSISTNEIELQYLSSLDIHAVLCPIVENMTNLFNAVN
jgi:hypothetical protein